MRATAVRSAVISWVNEGPPRLSLSAKCSGDIPPLLNHRRYHLAKNNNTAGKLVPSGGWLKSIFDGLERVPRADLHHPGLPLDLREV
jgi:hypothetical protein